jgi:hypothetical protein
MTQLPRTQPRGPEEKLTIADVCAELKISRSTFYDWRAKRRGPRCITLPNGKSPDPPPRPGPLARRPRGRRVMETTYDVRVYKTEVYRGTRVSSYTVRWKTGQRAWRRSFRITAQADVFRAELLSAARKGEAFSTATGEPVSWSRNEPGASWYDFTCSYVDLKWNAASAKYRRAIAQALAAATPVMLTGSYGKPDDKTLRHALVNWGYNTKQRNSAAEDVADALSWLGPNTREVADLADLALCRQLLGAAASRLDGTRAAATSVRRNRAVLLNALEYAVELGLIDENPIKKLKWPGGHRRRRRGYRLRRGPARQALLLGRPGPGLLRLQRPGLHRLRDGRHPHRPHDLPVAARRPPDPPVANPAG